ncbi:MAG: sialidase family protein [Patescibacteria group bacterium]|nr:sialidase family protein [Patescibacteria group bacterium]
MRECLAWLAFILMLPGAAAAEERAGGSALWIHPKARALTLADNAMVMLVLQDGSLLRVSRGGSQRSADDGKTWSAPTTIYDGPAPGRIGGGGLLLKTVKGTILLVYHDPDTRVLQWDRKTGEVSDDTRNDVWAIRSTDGGHTWGDRQHISSLVGELPYCLSLIQLAQLADGTIVVPLQPRRREPNRNVITTVTSRDEGETWTRSETILDIGGAGLHDGLLEPSVIGLRDARAYMLLRTNLGWLYESFSADGGLHWTEAKPTDLDASSAPSFMLRLADGRVLLAWNRAAPSDGSAPVLRQGAGWSSEPASWHRAELSVALSDDDCHTWSDPVVVARCDGRELAYPYVLERRPGTVWIITRYRAARGAAVQLEIDQSALCPPKGATP